MARVLRRLTTARKNNMKKAGLGSELQRSLLLHASNADAAAKFAAGGATRRASRTGLGLLGGFMDHQYTEQAAAAAAANGKVVKGSKRGDVTCVVAWVGAGPHVTPNGVHITNQPR